MPVKALKFGKEMGLSEVMPTESLGSSAATKRWPVALMACMWRGAM
jgi:hypothetical protein